MLSKQFPIFGCFPNWPPEYCGKNADAWLHPEFISVAHELFPSYRVIRKDSFDGDFYHAFYGNREIRFRPAMWLETPQTDLVVGDQIEILSQRSKNEPAIGRILEITWSPKLRQIEFTVHHRSYALPKTFLRGDLRCLTSRMQLKPSDTDHPAPGYQPPANLDKLQIDK